MPRAKKPQVPSGGAYGDRKAMEEVIANTPSDPSLAPAPASATPASQGDPMAAAAAFQMPGLTPLSAPSERPGESVTTGLAPTAPNPIDEVRAAYLRFPSEALRDIIEELELLS